MSDQAAESSASAESPVEKAPAKVRRISNPRPKKVAKTKASAEKSTPAEPVAEVPANIEIVREEKPEVPALPISEPSFDEEHASGGEWPEPEAASAGQPESASKRKRRRRKGKGGNSQQAGGDEISSAQHENAAPSPSAASTQQQPQPQQPRLHQQPAQQHTPRPGKATPEEHAKKAWKIFLAEVSEEGVALISDQDAKELARRCFRLAEIFIEEQGRRRQH